MEPGPNERSAIKTPHFPQEERGFFDVAARQYCGGLLPPVTSGVSTKVLLRRTALSGVWAHVRLGAVILDAVSAHDA